MLLMSSQVHKPNSKLYIEVLIEDTKDFCALCVGSETLAMHIFTFGDSTRNLSL